MKSLLKVTLFLELFLRNRKRRIIIVQFFGFCILVIMFSSHYTRSAFASLLCFLTFFFSHIHLFIIQDCVFTKNFSQTSLHVAWTGDLRVTSCTDCCRRWYFTFNGAECSSNMSKTRASALSRVPNTEKQMKARGRRPSAFICFEVFGTRDKARSPSF